MFTFFRLLSIFFVVLLSTSVHSIESKEPDVIQDVTSSSPEKVFDINSMDNEHLDNLSEDELVWYKKFQDGLVFFDGWKDISEEILVCLPQEDQSGVKSTLQAMGVRIGTEWSKDNDIRKIDTDQLRSWGKRLKEARSESSEDLKEAVRIISMEVDAILDQE